MAKRARTEFEGGSGLVTEGSYLKLVTLTPSPPLLVVQALLPALIAGSPLLIKVSSREPLVAGRALSEILTDCLSEQSPDLGATVATVCFAGGEPDLAKVEDRMLERSQRVVVYGGQSTIESVAQRIGKDARSKLIGHGPKLSLALICDTALDRKQRRREILSRLAFDVALFDQRGCLSLHWVFTDAELEPFARDLEGAMTELSSAMPSGPAMANEFASIQRARSLSAMSEDGFASACPLEVGTVLASRLAAGIDAKLLELSPGGRTVRVYQVPQLIDADIVGEMLEPWKGLLQGMAIEAGTIDAKPFIDLAHRLGVSHLCRAGDLQRVAADWPNGGHDPLAVYSRRDLGTG
jgi:hypothetical protein